MTLLIDIAQDEWLESAVFAEEVRPLLPEGAVLVGPVEGVVPGVRMVATSAFRPGLAERLPDLELVQKLGAGVETMTRDASLPAHVRIARLTAAGQAAEMAAYCLAYVLRDQRHLGHYDAAQRRAEWAPVEPARHGERAIGVLGLGQIGGTIAKAFAQLGFRALGWSRSPKTIPGVEAFHGEAGLDALLAASDVVIAILPATPATRHLLNAERFARFKEGAALISIGRGDVADEAALIRALDHGPLARAVLDVFETEPLPADDPLWRHPKVTVTPHVSGWHVDFMAEAIARNYKKLVAGEPVENVVDRAAGY